MTEASASEHAPAMVAEKPTGLAASFRITILCVKFALRLQIPGDAFQARIDSFSGLLLLYLGVKAQEAGS
jgi:hypothetical protein